MILKVTANKDTFKATQFTDGFNVVWADRKDDSAKRESRNGLGKSTLIEIIHFCLGSSTKSINQLKSLKGWAFTLLMRIENQSIEVTRSIDDPGFVKIYADTSVFPILPKIKDGSTTYSIKQWTQVLGVLCFGIPIENEDQKYKPSFRALLSYFIRRTKDAFSTPFEFFKRQNEWDKQTHNAFLLNLSWEHAIKIQELKDQKTGLQNFKKAIKLGVIDEFAGSLGDLETQKIRLKAQVDQNERDLHEFKVYPQYVQLREEVDRLTEEIHKEVNTNMMDKRLLGQYEKNLSAENLPASANIEQLYKDAGVSLPGITLRRIEDVKTFHDNIVHNRKAFLETEVRRIRSELNRREEALKVKSAEKDSKMRILNTHGALEEYTLLNTRHMGKVQKLNEITSMVENIKSFDSKLSSIKIDQEVLQQETRRDYDEREEIREKAITLFNSYSEFLYQAPGKLVLDIGPTGFKFNIEIERSGSTGINNMKIFCYDLMLATLWAERSPSPRVLIHDSNIFDGVDERQRALALQLAAQESSTHGFQYICTLNSDNIPWDEFSDGFNIENFIRVKLTDDGVAGCLLGVRF